MNRNKNVNNEKKILKNKLSDKMLNKMTRDTKFTSNNKFRNNIKILSINWEDHSPLKGNQLKVSFRQDDD